MQSFNDLNNFANTSVNYNSQSDYSITYGTPLGNTTLSSFEGSAFVVPKQIPVLAMSQITRDLLITLTFDPIAAVALTRYVGTDDLIDVVFDGVDRWIVTGIRTVAQYNNVFANLEVAIAPGYVGEFSFEVALDDQMGDPIQTYTVTVTAETSEVFLVPAVINYAEDQPARVSGIEITENYFLPTNYSVVIDTNTANGFVALAPGNVPSANLTFTSNTKANLNLSLANVVFVPAADFTANTNINTTVTRIYDSESSGKFTVANCTVPHPDFSAPTGYGWSEDFVTPIGSSSDVNLAITDLAVDKAYSSTITISPANMGNLQVGNTVFGNTVTYTGNKVTVNNSLANVTFVGNATAKLSGNLQYVQTQTTDSILQGNITIPVSYQIQAIHIFSNQLPGSAIPSLWGTRLESAGAPATANVDFWAYAYNSNITVSGGVTTYNFTTASTSNVNLSTFRSTSTSVYGPTSILLQFPRGITSRTYNLGGGRAGYFSCWIKLNRLQSGSVSSDVGLIRSDGTLGPGINLRVLPGNELRWNVADTLGGPGAYIDITGGSPGVAGTGIPVGVWTHLALQISAGTTGSSGTQVVSAWLNGVPVTGFYSGSTLQTGTNWAGRTFFGSITGFTFGAPFPASGTLAQQVDMYMDDIQIRTDGTPYTNLTAFVPEPVIWSNPGGAGNINGAVTQMVTGI